MTANPTMSQGQSGLQSPSFIGTRDLACIICGYNLKGLGVDGLCPECASPIERSSHGNWLRYSDRSWLDQIVRGLALVRLSRDAAILGLLAMLSFVGIGGLISLFDEHDGAFFESVFFQSVINLFVVGLLLTPLGVGVGLWMASKPDALDSLKRPRTTLTFRALSIAVIPAFGIWIELGQRTFATPLPVTPAISNVCFAIVVAHGILLIDHLRRLEHRCEGFDGKRHRLFARHRRDAFIVATIFPALFWIGPFRWRQGWVMPSPATGAALLFWAGIWWVMVMGLVKGTTRYIREEYAAKT